MTSSCFIGEIKRCKSTALSRNTRLATCLKLIFEYIWNTKPRETPWNHETWMILDRFTGQAVGFLDMLCAFAGYTKVTGAVKPELTEDLDFEFIRGSDIAYMIWVCNCMYFNISYCSCYSSPGSWNSFMEFLGSIMFVDIPMSSIWVASFVSHTFPSQDPNAPLAVKATVGKCLNLRRSAWCHW